jgi:hypothetical protein
MFSGVYSHVAMRYGPYMTLLNSPQTAAETKDAAHRSGLFWFAAWAFVGIGVVMVGVAIWIPRLGSLSLLALPALLLSLACYLCHLMLRRSFEFRLRSYPPLPAGRPRPTAPPPGSSPAA